MAGVALGDIHLHFAWQAWHLVTSTVTLRGRRGTYGTDIHLHFAWQACHLVTSTFTFRGRRGTWRHGPPLCGRRLGLHPPSFRGAGVALGHIHLRFAWHACHLWHWAGSGVTRHLCHTPSFTHHFVTHHLSHTIFDTPSFKTLSHTIFVTQHLSHTIFHTPSFTPNFVTHHL